MACVGHGKQQMSWPICTSRFIHFEKKQQQDRNSEIADEWETSLNDSFSVFVFFLLLFFSFLSQQTATTTEK